MRDGGGVGTGRGRRFCREVKKGVVDCLIKIGTKGIAARVLRWVGMLAECFVEVDKG